LILICGYINAISLELSYIFAFLSCFDAIC